MAAVSTWYILHIHNREGMGMGGELRGARGLKIILNVFMQV